MKLKPHPFFDTKENHKKLPYASIISKLSSINIDIKEYDYCHDFLSSYDGSNDTFNTYRREVDKLLQWCWIIKNISLKEINRKLLMEYIDFVKKPPKEWMNKGNVKRFINENINEHWKPFIKPATSSSLKSTLACLSSFFTFLAQEEFTNSNPVLLIRQKSKLFQKQQEIRTNRKISEFQWETIINEIKTLAEKNNKYFRTYFALSAFYLLGVRISELAKSPIHEPKMGNFFRDENGLWWFSTIGKGNKYREIAVPDDLLLVLKQYRKSLSLNPLPLKHEQTPLIVSETKSTNIGIRQLRTIITDAFNIAINKLNSENLSEEAMELEQATVHWLRHTSISNDIKHRPREHIRDDVGHSSPTTMDKYIDIDRNERHSSAKNKKLIN